VQRTQTTIEVNDGMLRVNGVPHGRISDASVVRYNVQGNRKTLTVDGVVREPER
jgi:hypothetical protein